MDMGNILIASVFMLVVFVFLGIGMAYPAQKLRVEEDPRIDEVNNRLPQANCGACGKAGCRGFAEAVVMGELDPGKCTVSSPEVKSGIAEYLGVTVEEHEKMTARLACAGGTNVARNKADFSGIDTCRNAARSGGGKGCSWGCLGLGDCARACDFGAITMNEYGLPVVDSAKCTACKECVIACPKKLFSIVPEALPLWVACKNLQMGQPAKEECKVACTGCGNCVTDAPKGLIKIVDGLAVIDYESGLPLTEKPTKQCPTGAIVWKK
ncbi:MAG: RnfABCDGE type electron transport complex subunit B [Candidatus Paceibacterota bacterium]